MPRVSHLAAVLDMENKQLVTVKKGNGEQSAYILDTRGEQIYVHYVNTDKRMDEWVPRSSAQNVEGVHTTQVSSPPRRGRKRKRTPVTIDDEAGDLTNGFEHHDSPFPGVAGGNTSEDDDIAEHQLLTRRRNFDVVNFGEWQMKTWYFSPYPITEAESEELSLSIAHKSRLPASSQVNSKTATANEKNNRKSSGKSVQRTTLRSHGRTADMLAGGLNRDSTREDGQPNVLWVCDRCFKYMNEGLPYEIHTKSCNMAHPPGEKVWVRGAHMIWEVDGAAQKLYCQNLALFGKLFIDVKTLFFDTENFLFYVLIEAKPSRDKVIGFFSKEKVSYDDYNLACIIILPPFQRKGYGMLLMEFSYVLSRRAGIMGTPERPLSDLGLRGYLSYWISTLIRFFRAVMQVSPSEIPGAASINAADTNRKRKRASKGKVSEGEHHPSQDSWVNGVELNAAELAYLRTPHITMNWDGSVTTHVSVRCTVEDISRATFIRIEDVAFALSECGLLRHRREEEEEEAQGQDVIVVSREMIEKVAKERNAKRSIIRSEHLVLK